MHKHIMNRFIKFKSLIDKLIIFLTHFFYYELLAISLELRPLAALYSTFHKFLTNTIERGANAAGIIISPWQPLRVKLEIEALYSSFLMGWGGYNASRGLI